MKKILTPQTIKKITNLFLKHRKGFIIKGWNDGPGEECVLRYLSGKELRNAKVIHVYTEMFIDKSFGVFSHVIQDIIRFQLNELIVLFKRPMSSIVTFYRITKAEMDRTLPIWGEGKDGQFQIPIVLFEKLGEIVLP